MCSQSLIKIPHTVNGKVSEFNIQYINTLLTAGIVCSQTSSAVRSHCFTNFTSSRGIGSHCGVILLKNFHVGKKCTHGNGTPPYTPK